MRELKLTVEPRMFPIFLPVLQSGFFLATLVGCSIREFLRDQCGIPQETIANRISTIFLNGMPVDDLDRAIITDGSTLALSGAMPGLMGATMRINSPFKSFRDSISHDGEQRGAEPHHGMVRLKLFNTVMGELGRRFLGEGVLLHVSAVEDLLTKLAKMERDGFGEISLDGESIELSVLLNQGLLSDDALVSLSVWVRG